MRPFGGEEFRLQPDFHVDCACTRYGIRVQKWKRKFREQNRSTFFFRAYRNRSCRSLQTVPDVRTWRTAPLTACTIGQNIPRRDLRNGTVSDVKINLGTCALGIGTRAIFNDVDKFRPNVLHNIDARFANGHFFSHVFT